MEVQLTEKLIRNKSWWNGPFVLQRIKLCIEDLENLFLIPRDVNTIWITVSTTPTIDSYRIKYSIPDCLAIQDSTGGWVTFEALYNVVLPIKRLLEADHFEKLYVRVEY